MTLGNGAITLSRQGIAVVVICIGLLLVLEFVGRSMFPPGRPKYWNPVYGTVQPPNYTAGHYRTNSLGFRGPEISLEKPGGTFRIAFVGGSVVEAVHVKEEDTFAYQVQQKLYRILKGRPTIEVIIAAGDSRTSHYALSHIVNRILPLDPDLIIQLDASDMWGTLDPSYEPTMYWKSRPLYGQNTLRQWLKANSGLFRGIRRMRDLASRELASLKGGQSKNAGGASRKLDPPDEVLFRDPQRPFDNIHRIGLLTREAGVNYAVMTQAWLYKPELPPEEVKVLRGLQRGGWNMSVDTALRSIKSYNDSLRRLAMDDDLILIDTDRLLPKDLDHYIDDVHLTARGHEVVADAIVHALMQEDDMAWIIPDSI